MDNVYNDVLRICDTTVGDALATKMLNKQAGFATNSHYWAMKSAGGTVYYYPTTAHRHDTHTLEHDAVTSDGGAFAFTTSGTWTLTIAAAEMLTVGASAVIINEGSADVDFRVESNGNANMLYVDGGNDAVGIGVVPNASNVLEVAGKVRIGDAGAAGVDLGVRVDQNATTVIEVRNENNHASARAICASASNVASGYFGSFPTLANTAEFRDKTVAYSTKILALCGVDDEVQVYAGGTAAVNKIATFTTDGLGIGRVPAYGVFAIATPTDYIEFVDGEKDNTNACTNTQGYYTMRTGTLVRYIQTYTMPPEP